MIDKDDELVGLGIDAGPYYREYYQPNYSQEYQPSYPSSYPQSQYPSYTTTYSYPVETSPYQRVPQVRKVHQIHEIHEIHELPPDEYQQQPESQYPRQRIIQGPVHSPVHYSKPMISPVRHQAPPPQHYQHVPSVHSVPVQRVHQNQGPVHYVQGPPSYSQTPYDQSTRYEQSPRYEQAPHYDQGPRYEPGPRYVQSHRVPEQRVQEQRIQDPRVPEHHIQSSHVPTAHVQSSHIQSQHVQNSGQIARPVHRHSVAYQHPNDMESPLQQTFPMSPMMTGFSTPVPPSQTKLQQITRSNFSPRKEIKLQSPPRKQKHKHKDKEKDSKESTFVFYSTPREKPEKKEPASTPNDVFSCMESETISANSSPQYKTHSRTHSKGKNHSRSHSQLNHHQSGRLGQPFEMEMPDKLGFGSDEMQGSSDSNELSPPDIHEVLADAINFSEIKSFSTNDLHDFGIDTASSVNTPIPTPGSTGSTIGKYSASSPGLVKSDDGKIKKKLRKAKSLGHLIKPISLQDCSSKFSSVSNKFSIIIENDEVEKQITETAKRKNFVKSKPSITSFNSIGSENFMESPPGVYERNNSSISLISEKSPNGIFRVSSTSI